MAELIPIDDTLEFLDSPLHGELIELRERNVRMSMVADFSEKILDSANVWVQVFDREGRILIWNRAAEEISGYRREELEGMEDFWLILFEDPVWIYSLFDFLHDASDVENADPIVKLIRTKSGETKTLQLSALEWRNEAEIPNYIIIGNDISERERIRKEKTRLEQRIFQAAKTQALVQVVKGVTHEIANPVSVVRDDLQTLERALKSLQDGGGDERTWDRVLRLFARDKDAIERVSKIVTSFKTTYRPENWRKININTEAEAQYILLYADRSGSKNIEKRLSPVPEVWGYGNEIAQVILNLLTNALDASEESGTIVMESGEAEETVFLKVTDTGEGIPDELREKIFEYYFTTKQSGSGLGLALSREIMHKHHGRLYVERSILAPTEGHGTCFQMELPKVFEEIDEISCIDC